MSAQNYLDILSKLKFADPSANQQEHRPARESNTLSTYTQDFGRSHPEYTIKVRLLPDFKRNDPNPYLRRYHQFMSDVDDGRWINVGCPGGKNCPICNTTYSMWRGADALLRDQIKKYFCKKFSYLNCYVIDNPVDPTQNGKVKLIKLNQALLKVFDVATTGRDSKRFGSRIFRLDNAGTTFNIDIKVRGGYPQFADSYFIDPEDCAGDVAGLDMNAQNEICEKTMNIAEVFVPDTVETIRDVMNNHIRIPGMSTQSVAEVSPVVVETAQPVMEKQHDAVYEPAVHGSAKMEKSAVDKCVSDVLGDIDRDLGIDLDGINI